MNRLGWVAAAAVTVLGTAAQAADKLPQQGTASYVTYYVSRQLTNLDMGEVGAQALVELVGITRNTSGTKAFDNLSARCILFRDNAGGKLKVSGSCTETDADGDKMFVTFDAEVHTLVGGTGKYKGISGSAPYTVAPAPSPGPGLGAVVVDHKISWQF
jgi:hypothetical protein